MNYIIPNNNRKRKLKKTKQPARREYHQAVDGEWVQPKMRGFREQCCGCALIHELDFKVVEGRVQFRATVDRRATAAARRAFKFTPDND